MKHLRSKLFLSVGSILLIVALLNFFLPRILVEKELNKDAQSLQVRIDDLNHRLRHFSAFLLSFRMVESAAEFEEISKKIDEELLSKQPSQTSLSSWELGSLILTYNPQIAFVQITDPKGHCSVIAPEDGNLYFPSYAPFEQGMLWVQIPEKSALYVGIPTGASTYLLFDEESSQTFTSSQKKLSQQLHLASSNFSKAHTLTFLPLKRPSAIIDEKDSIQQLYKYLEEQIHERIEKIDLLQQLATWQQDNRAKRPSGILQIDTTFNESICLLSDEVFSTEPIFNQSVQNTPENTPIIFLHQKENRQDLDVVKVLDFKEADYSQIVLGLSVSSIVQTIAQIIQRPILVVQNNQLEIGYTSQGTQFDVQEIHSSVPTLESSKLVTWEGTQYEPYTIDFNVMQLIILTPEDQASALAHFLDRLRYDISFSISSSLLLGALISFILALILLSRISKKITDPIALLSKASEELGMGKYDQIILPSLGHRQDEIAVLSHSFESMVGALRDRDKIRGVLNKVVSKEISEEILKHDIELGGEERSVTMLFSDIRGFTHLSENMKPKELIGKLNTYMTNMCRIIDQTHGVVDKFVGDEIMALYGIPLTMEDHAIHAIEASILMIESLRSQNSETPHFEIGIGIHTGLVCVGNIGAENRLNYTVIGANVNLASRLCTHALPMQIIVSESTWKLPGVQQKFKFKQLEPCSLKGIDQPVQCYEVVSKSDLNAT